MRFYFPRETYLEALKAVGRWADEKLEPRTADAVLICIGYELDRLGVDPAERVAPHANHPLGRES